MIERQNDADTYFIRNDTQLPRDYIQAIIFYYCHERPVGSLRTGRNLFQKDRRHQADMHTALVHSGHKIMCGENSLDQGTWFDRAAITNLPRGRSQLNGLRDRNSHSITQNS